MYLSFPLRSLFWLSVALSTCNAVEHSQQSVFAVGNEHAVLRGKNAAVACEADLCSRVGITLNEQGGNAADMMVGTTLCIGVVAMYHAGIGGGGFALVHHPNGTHVALDFREAAPSGSSPDMWETSPLTQLFGGLASGIPGELRGLEYIHKNFGVLQWSEVVDPAIRLARDGWEVNQDLERYMDVTVSRIGDFFTTNPTWAEDFAPNGTRVRVGDRIYRPKLAKALEKIAHHGADAFYTGEMARQTVQAVRKAGGLFTEDDMRNYKIQVREPISIEYGNFTVTSVPAPAGGASVLSILKIMEQFGFADGTNLTMHRLNEAFRFAFGGRAVMGDPAYVDRVDELQKLVTSENYAKDVKKQISDEHTLEWGDYTPSGFETHDSHGTSHLVTSDSSGLMITLTTTVNFYFGSGVMVPETGIILNDQMADFSVPRPAPPFYHPPAPANFARAGKRPLSACSPTIVTIKHTTNDESSAAKENTTISLPILALGAAGGSRIITLVASLLLTLLPPYLPHPSSSSSEPRTLKEALAFPRIHDSLTPNETSLEFGETLSGVHGFNNATAAFLASRGHNLAYVEPHYSAAQAIRWECDGQDQDCGFVAASDPRHRVGGARVR